MTVPGATSNRAPIFVSDQPRSLNASASFFCARRRQRRRIGTPHRCKAELGGEFVHGLTAQVAVVVHQQVDQGRLPQRARMSATEMMGISLPTEGQAEARRATGARCAI